MDLIILKKLKNNAFTHSNSFLTFQGPRRHFESGWANTSEFFEKKILKGPLFSKFSKSGWAMAHMAHMPTRALICKPV